MFEIMQKISDEALKTCPETGQNVKRVITGGSGVVYKGSGWYVTDYKNRSGNGANGSNSSTNGADPSSAGKASVPGGASANGSAENKAGGNGQASGATTDSTGKTASSESGS